MKQDKTVYLILALILIIVLILIFQILSKSTTPPKFTGTSEPIASSSPTTFSTTTPSPSNQELTILPTTLNSDVINIGASYFVKFSKPILLTNLTYHLTPPLSTKQTLDNSGLLLTITPATTWAFDTEYQITFPKGLKSKNGSVLKSDVVLKFKTNKYGGI